MVCFVLEQNGFQTIEADDYDSTIAQLIEPYPALILLDWMIPGGSGIQLIAHIRRDQLIQNIPIMMLTARGGKKNGCEV